MMYIEDKIYLFVIIFLVLVMLMLKCKEHLTIVGFNDSDLPDNNIENEIKNANFYINSKLNLSNTDDLDTTNFILYNPNLPFPFNKTFIDLTSKYLKLNNNVGTSITIGNPTDIYYKDIINSQDDTLDRVFIFSSYIIDDFLTRNYIIKIIVYNISQFIDDKNNYIQDKNYLNVDGKVLKIQIIKDNINLNVLGIDSLNPNNYEITNKLHLTAPFSSSKTSNDITESMKQNFQIILDQKQSKKSLTIH